MYLSIFLDIFGTVILTKSFFKTPESNTWKDGKHISATKNWINTVNNVL